MESGLPESPGNYVVVETEDLKIRVPGDMIFSGDIPKVMIFPRRTGERSVGVPNVIF